MNNVVNCVLGFGVLPFVNGAHNKFQHWSYQEQTITLGVIALNKTIHKYSYMYFRYIKCFCT